MIYKNLFLFTLTAVLAVNSFAQADQRIAAIRELYSQTNAKVAECEQNGETSSTFLTELVVNKNNGSYPAVGIYRSVAKFYYTYGDREKNPYPNRLLKITVETKRSNRTEVSEFLFNETGRLVFYFEAKDETEKRVYFEKGKAFRILDGERETRSTDKSSQDRVKRIENESAVLSSIFKSISEF